MERNLLNRVETCFPIENEKWIKRMQQELDLYLEDNCQSWELQRDGQYIKKEPKDGEERVSAQQTLLEVLT